MTKEKAKPEVYTVSFIEKIFNSKNRNSILLVSVSLIIIFAVIVPGVILRYSKKTEEAPTTKAQTETKFVVSGEVASIDIKNNEIKVKEFETNKIYTVNIEGLKTAYNLPAPVGGVFSPGSTKSGGKKIIKAKVKNSPISALKKGDSIQVLASENILNKETFKATQIIFLP